MNDHAFVLPVPELELVGGPYRILHVTRIEKASREREHVIVVRLFAGFRKILGTGLVKEEDHEKEIADIGTNIYGKRDFARLFGQTPDWHCGEGCRICPKTLHIR